MTKQELRKLFLTRRHAFSTAEYESLNQKLCEVFFSSVDLTTVFVIHIFLPILSKKEPDTWLIIDRLKKEFSSVRISIPRMNGDQLINYFLEDGNQIKENQWNIPEPQFGEITAAEKIDLVIVPLLAFDLKGNRVGYGKGYYDRFLKQCRPDCKKVGLSFFEPVQKIIDVDDYDVKLTQCITPEKSFVF